MKHIVIWLSICIWVSYYKFTKKTIDFWYVAVLKLFFFIVILNFKIFLRTSIQIPILNPKLFKKQLLIWSQQFREVIFL
jgi:hypothetical protein